MYDLQQYLNEDGKSPFEEWILGLDRQARAKVTIALTRMGNGNLSNVKGVGGGVLEFRINYGPGYRIYFGMDGKTLIILLAGGTKVRQDQDIQDAKKRWQDYKQRKRKGEN